MLLSLTASCGKDEAVPPSEQNGSQNGQGGNNQDDSTAPIIVTIDADGKADGGHHFVNIDGVSFYIDDIKYTATKGDLLVTGYNDAFFKGEAKIISQLNYVGREMHVIEIMEKAFEGCTVLTTLTISEGVTSIGAFAFSNCTGLTSVTIPSSVASIEENAFAYCKSLASIFVAEANPIYDSRNNCYAIIETESNTLIAGCKNTNIPSSVTSIGNGAFAGCTGLTSVTIPSSVISIGYDAFRGCTGLTSVFISEGVTSIPGQAFQGCTGLTSVTIPSSVTSIGDGAFQGCTGLASVTIPSSVTSIGMGAFQGCTGLTSIIVADDNPTYDSRDNSNAIIETESNILIVGCKNTNIPSSVTSIGNEAFSSCTGLISVTIPSSVTNIGYYAFGGCTGLTHVYCEAERIPSTNWEAFDNTPIANATLHVPASAIDAYRNTSPWSGFGKIEVIQ